MQRFRDAEENAKYQRLLATDHRVEYLMAIGDGIVVDGELVEYILDDEGNLIPVTEGTHYFGSSTIRSLQTHHRMFEGEEPSVGNVIAGDIEVVVNRATGTIPKAAKLMIYIRLTDALGVEKTPYLQKGVYFIDTREVSMDEDGLAVLTIHGYDSLRKVNGDFPGTRVMGEDIPPEEEETDRTIINQIAGAIGVTVDERTWKVMAKTVDAQGNPTSFYDYKYGIPIGYSMQEVLSYIAGSYGGNFIITDLGQLRLVSLAYIPRETSYLIDHVGFVITFGQAPHEVVRITV